MCRFTVQPVQAGSQYSQGVRQRSQAASTASTGRQLVQPCSQPARQTLSSHDTVRQRPPAGASARIVFSFSTIRAVGCFYILILLIVYFLVLGAFFVYTPT